MFALVVRFDLIPGSEPLFDQLAAETRSAVERDEPDTLVYLTHSMIGAPAARVFYELYRDRPAFDRHERNEHTRRFLERRGLYLAAPPRVEFLDGAQGTGLPG